MTQEEEQSGRAKKKPARRPYEPPRIIGREPLEAVAAVCSGGTAKANPVQCPTGPIHS